MGKLLWVCRAVGRGRGSQVESMASRRKCLLKFSIIVDLSVLTVFPILSAVGSWEEVLLFSMDYIIPDIFGVCATGCKILF